MEPPRSIGIAGSGNIACGLAVACAPFLEARLYARSPASAERARRTVERMAKGSTPADILIEQRLDGLTGCSVLVEAVAEDMEAKTSILQALAQLPGEAPLVTTTSSMSLSDLARASGTPERVAAVHVFTPVYQVPLVELAFPDAATEPVRATVRVLCEAIGKTVVEVPAIPGFVVNRVIFPMLLAAVETYERTGLPAEAIDDAMRLSLGHPIGPLRTLDIIGVDVAVAIAQRLELGVPRTLRAMAATGALGRKTRAGFYAYAA